MSEQTPQTAAENRRQLRSLAVAALELIYCVANESADVFPEEWSRICEQQNAPARLRECHRGPHPIRRLDLVRRIVDAVNYA